ncbi:MAG: vanadium-dependent haloperoxidase [Vicinamibacterales bacterium]
MRRMLIFGVMLAAALTASGARAVAAAHASPAVVLTWNQLIQSTLAQPGNPLSPRFYAMAHIAMFDAINALEREYEPYRVRLRPGLGGSAAAAAAQAAHDVLVALNPSAKTAYDQALTADLGAHPSGFVRRGAEIGAHVAKAILAWRLDDGWVVSSFPPYAEPSLPGRWQPTPPANAAAAFTHLQHAVPMALLSATQLLPVPAPSLTTARYAADVNEVKLFGRSDSAVRTEDQTTVARLWSGVGTTTGFFSVWNNVARDIVVARHLSLVDAARVFVLVNVSIHDALQTTQASKFVYGVWRPVTAIRAADTDLNPATDPDSTWLPLIATPPYPSYAGNLAAIGASAARVLQLICGTNDVPVAISWTLTGGPPTVTRHFDGFWQAAEEEAMARIYGGVHYRFDQEAGQQVGVSVADFVFANVVRPRSRWSN